MARQPSPNDEYRFREIAEIHQRFIERLAHLITMSPEEFASLGRARGMIEDIRVKGDVARKRKEDAATPEPVLAERDEALDAIADRKEDADAGTDPR